MGKKLVIVESPAKAKTINKYLGKEYDVEASMGHIRDLPKSRLGVDLDKDFEPSYSIIDRAKKTVTKLKKLAKNKEAIYLAPDPDREGEAISWHLHHIFREASKDIPIYRVTFNEITKTAVKDAFEHARDIDMDLVDSQQARRVLDRIVGYQISPLLWKNVAKGLSAGRVQSITVRLIMEREAEIEAFTPKEYWNIVADLYKGEKKDNVRLLAKLDKIDGKKAEVDNEKNAKEIVADLEKAKFVVQKVEERKKSRKPQAPFTTSRLQQEAYTRLRFSSQKTMQVAQRLYEGIEIGDEGSVGLITYMRTDSVNVSNQAQEEAREFIKAKYGDEFLPAKPNVYKSKKKAQEAHEAIRPTLAKYDPEEIKKYLSDDEFKLYSLIWRKFVASQMVPAKDSVTSIEIGAGEKYLLRASGTRNLFKGYLICYDEPVEKKGDDEQEPTEMPKLKAEEELNLEKLTPTQHFTKPPARYNDASIVRTLEELGIGRPSTYAPTIMTIIQRNYVERKSGALHPTEMGKIVTKLLIEHFQSIMDYKFTAQMEDDLDKIEQGKVDWHKVLKNFYGSFKDHVEKATQNMTSVKKVAEPTEFKCKKCSKPVVIKWGRFGKFLACTGFPNCNYTAPIPTGIKCPEENCDGDLIKRMSKRRRVFYGCSNYPNCKYITNKLPKTEDSEEEAV